MLYTYKYIVRDISTVTDDDEDIPVNWQPLFLSRVSRVSISPFLGVN